MGNLSKNEIIKDIIEDVECELENEDIIHLVLEKKVSQKAVSKKIIVLELKLQIV